MVDKRAALLELVTVVRKIEAAAASRLTLIEEWILTNDANINSRDGSGQTLLHKASAAGDCELAELLLNYRATIDSLDNDSNTPLHVVCSNGHLDVVELLVELGANVNSCDRNSFTPLHKASENGFHEIAECLLENGASISNNHWYTPLHKAAGAGHEKVVAVLLKHGAGNPPTSNEQTPLALAAENGHHEVVSLLLQSNAYVDSVEDEDTNETPLFLASQGNHVRVVEILLDYGASIDRECLTKYNDRRSNTALDAAANWGSRDAVSLLLNNGAKIVNSYTTSLHHAAFGGNQEICEDLIRAGADVNADDAYGLICLHCARSPESVRYLISQGADINKRNSEGLSPLHTVCCDIDEKVDVIVAMLEVGLDVHARDNRGRTPLHVTCISDFDRAAKALLEWGADIHCRDNTGCTPLHLAASRGNFKIVKLLVEGGSDINLVSSEILSALDYASAALSEARYDGKRNSLRSIIAYLDRHVMLMRSVNMYLRPSLLKDFEFKKLDQQCIEESVGLKTAYIGNSNVSCYSFLGRSIDQIVLTLKNPKILEALNSGWYKTEFPNFGILIGSHLNKGNVRKQLIDRVFRNCSEVFTGLLEECIYEILSFLNNKELSVFADSLVETSKIK